MPDYNLDPRQILLKRKSIMLPLPIVNSTPEQSPNGLFPKGTVFFDANEYFLDENDRVYFLDPVSNEMIYLSQIDTTNNIHMLKARFIKNELYGHTTQMRIPGTINRDTVLEQKRVGVEFLGNQDVIALTQEDGSVAVNYNRRGGLQDNVYSIYSTFRHENIHIIWNHYGKDKRIGSLEHANVYQEQMTYEDFSNAPFEYQLKRILLYASNVISEYDSNNNFNISAINNCFNNFHDNIGKYIGATIQFKPQRKKIHISIMGTSRELDYVKRDPMAHRDE